MSGQPGFSDNLGGHRIDCGQCAVSEPHVDLLRRRVVPHVVRVIAQANHGTGPVVFRTDQLKTITLAVCDSDRSVVGDNGDSLGFTKPSKALEVRRGGRMLIRSFLPR